MNEDNDLRGGYEKQDVDGKRVLTFVWASAAAIAVIMWMVVQYYNKNKEVYYDRIALTPQQKIAVNARERDKKILSEYKVLDKEKKIFRIPIDRAVKLMLDEAYEQRKLLEK